MFFFIEGLAAKKLFAGPLLAPVAQRIEHLTSNQAAAGLSGSWQIRGVFDKTKDVLRQIAIDVYRDEKVCAYISLNIKN